MNIASTFMSYQIRAIDYFLDSVSRYPNHVAICDQGKSYTYVNLHARAVEISQNINQHKTTKKYPVIIALNKGFDAIAAIIATQLAGHIYVPIDVQSPNPRLLAISEQLGEFMVISNTEIMGKLTCMNKSVCTINVDNLKANTSEVELEIDTGIDADPLYIIFTSGSTGTPKGVTISHRSVIDYIEWAKQNYPMAASDVMMSQAPLYFDNSTLDLYLTWANGASLLIPDDKIYMFPIQVLETMNLHKVTTIFWVPSVLINLANSGLLPEVNVPTLRNILFAGEPMPVPQINEWVKNYRGCLFSNLYGPTEITVDCTAYTFFEPFSGTNLPIGYACRNTNIIILNEQKLPCSPNEIGELYVRGSSLALGYWNDIEKTERVFIQNPHQKNYRDLLYQTGDLVRRDEFGLITFTGRKDTQIKHMGYRIELGEIDSCISQHPDIALACTIYIKEKNKIACIATAKNGSIVEIIELKRFLSDKLPRYMIPSIFKIVDHMPMNANGKIDRIKISQTLD